MPIDNAKLYEYTLPVVRDALAKLEDGGEEPLMAIFRGDVNGMDEFKKIKDIRGFKVPAADDLTFNYMSKIANPPISIEIAQVKLMGKTVTYENLRNKWKLGNDATDPYVTAAIIAYFTERLAAKKFLAPELNKLLTLFSPLGAAYAAFKGSKEPATYDGFNAGIEGALRGWKKAYLSVYPGDDNLLSEPKLDALLPKPANAAAYKAKRKELMWLLGCYIMRWIQDAKAREEDLQSHTKMLAALVAFTDNAKMKGLMRKFGNTLQMSDRENRLIQLGNTFDGLLGPEEGAGANKLRAGANTLLIRVESLFRASNMFTHSDIKRFITEKLYHEGKTPHGDEIARIEAYAISLNELLAKTFDPWRETIAAYKLYVSLLDKFQHFVKP